MKSCSIPLPRSVPRICQGAEIGAVPYITDNLSFRKGVNSEKEILEKNSLEI
jgi:hypothetical protein